MRNDELRYESTEDAVRRWPETATNVAVPFPGGKLEILAPFGLSDLFSMIVRPTPAFVGDKFPLFTSVGSSDGQCSAWPK
jgi:hypothetical protein